MERTLGFDFGTHQTKICVEEKEGANIGYHFFPFKDTDGNINYLLPSIVRINLDNTLSYGYIDNEPGEIVRYFKQATYCTGEFTWTNHIRADYFSIWYIAYILFFVEQAYETNFATNMGVPTDTASLDKNKVRAVSIMLSAIKLVEDVFKNDLNAFLKCTVQELFDKTEIVACSKQLKEDYSILVFPEAYACLRPLTARKKIATGMSLMVDIGGGTTDISFFTIENGNAQIYKFISIAKGLNFLTGIDGDNGHPLNPTSITSSEISLERKLNYENTLERRLSALIDALYRTFSSVCDLDLQRLRKALKNRPIIFAGGGSTFNKLCKAYINFTAVRKVSVADWNLTCFPEFEKMGLCPILNTAYGLSISESALSDEITITPFNTIFNSLRGASDKPQKVTIDPRDGTQTILDSNSFAERETVINWRVCRFISERTMVKRPLSAKDVGVADNIERVKSSDINLADYFFKQEQKSDKSTCEQEYTHKLEHTQTDVDEYLMLNYEHYIPIPDSLRDLYASNIPDPEVRENFILKCAELAEECKLYEEQKRKDRETRDYLETLKNRVQPTTSPVPTQKDRQRIVQSPVKHINLTDFRIGDTVEFLNEKGGGIISDIDCTTKTLKVEIDKDFILEYRWDDCIKVTKKTDTFFTPKKSNDTVIHKVEVKQKSKEEKKMEISLQALLEKYNKK